VTFRSTPHGRAVQNRLVMDAAEDAWSQMQAWFKKYKVLG
jgi:hypothetical protein